MRAVARKRMQMVRCLFSIVVIALFAGACSSSGPAQQAAATPESVPAQSGDDGGQDDEGYEADTGAEAGPTSVPEPTLGDQDLASVVELQAGQQVQDAQGNLIAIYGIAQWPEPFAALSDAAQAGFSFFGDVEAAVDPASELVVLDVGMCAAGLDVTGFGTAEFFVHESPTEMLSTDPVLNRGVLVRHPVVRPGFGFPLPAECERGFLPVLWSGDQAPTVARYVLATRPSASTDVEQHVYQWQLGPIALGGSGVDPGGEDADAARSPADPDEMQFDVGQTVTFHQGRLQDMTVEVDGWAELIGTESPLDGTRLVAVSLGFCPASQRLPEFGLGVDHWNIVAPTGDGVLGASVSADPTSSCFEGWLEFAIPFGSEPTAFFASDGANADTGYAEWSLVGSALPAPLS